MPGPLKVAVRFVVLRLCVPVSACSVELVSVGEPNGNQPPSEPSSQSLWIDVSAPMLCVTLAASSSGASLLEQPSAATETDNETKRVSRRLPIFDVSPEIPWPAIDRTQQDRMRDELVNYRCSGWDRPVTR